MVIETTIEKEKLCNAVILASPNNKIIGEWLQQYKEKYGTKELCWWAGLSTQVPFQLYKKYKQYGEFKLVQSSAFYPFYLNDWAAFGSHDQYDRIKDSHCIYLWETEADKARLLPKS